MSKLIDITNISLDLVDECHLFLNPVIGGGGKPASPAEAGRHVLHSRGEAYWKHANPLVTKPGTIPQLAGHIVESL